MSKLTLAVVVIGLLVGGGACAKKASTPASPVAHQGNGTGGGKSDGSGLHAGGNIGGKHAEPAVFHKGDGTGGGKGDGSGNHKGGNAGGKHEGSATPQAPDVTPN